MGPRAMTRPDTLAQNPDSALNVLLPLGHHIFRWLKRYLWVQILPGTQGKKEDTRFEGGFPIYDGPEAWDPWTTVFFTNKWGVGPGETASFPTKWMSADGRTLHLVFSGDDSFSVRQATLR